MSNTLETQNPPDICLLLRVHAEQRWLVAKVIPSLRELERRGAIVADEDGAALAYLEVLWLEAGLRSAETEAAAAKLHPHARVEDSVLCERAHRYHAAVRRLRHAVDRRVRLLTAPSHAIPPQRTPEATGL